MSLSSGLILCVIGGYFLLLLSISYFTSRNATQADFFIGSKKSPWYLVAFGMIGATLSGVTFISVPGIVRDGQFGYMQLVFGFFVGTFVIAYVLLPIYYRNNVISIYQFLDKRLGVESYKTGAFFFLLSRTIGASFRIFLVALAFQYLIFEQWGVPFSATVVLSILLIWIYTSRGGIKTIVWTDSLQTFFMLAAVIISVFLILDNLNWTFMDFLQSEEIKAYNQIFHWENFLTKDNFIKAFFGGIFMAIAMTGLDQDMMQKNLSCKNLKDAQKNMISMITLLVFVNFFFMLLGALLFIFAEKNGVSVPLIDGKERLDLLFPEIAMNSGLGLPLAIVFILGLVAAAYSSADSALTSLTTSVCVDFLDIQNVEVSKQKKLRQKVHILVSISLALVVIGFYYLLDQSVITGLFTVATYTYGPLMGLFFFAILTPYKVKGKFVLLICLLSVTLSYFLNEFPNIYAYINAPLKLDVCETKWLCAQQYAGLNYYNFGFELLGINGLITFLGLFLIRKKE